MTEKMVKKNIELPEWVVGVIDGMASDVGNKFKPYVEWRLIKMATMQKSRIESEVYRPKLTKSIKK